MCHVVRTHRHYDMTHRSSTDIAELIVPVHPPKFAQCFDLLESMILCGQHRFFTVLLVLSSSKHEEDMQQRMTADRNFSAFRGLLETQRLRTFIAPQSERLTCQRTECVRSYKVWAALDHTFRKRGGVQHAATLDCDAEFQSTQSFRKHFTEWSRQRMVIGNQWHRSCNTAYFCHDWFGDLPIFERASFPLFFDAINLSSHRNRYPWDYCAYNCFNAYVRKWTMINIQPFTGGRRLDMCDSRVQDSIQNSSGHKFIWSRDPNPARLLQFHIDRNPYCRSRSSRVCSTNVVRRSPACDPKWLGWT